MLNLRMSDGSFSATTGRLEMFVTYMAQCLRKTVTTLVKARTTALVCRNSKRLPPSHDEEDLNHLQNKIAKRLREVVVTRSTPAQSSIITERVKIIHSSMVPSAVIVGSPKAVATRSRTFVISTAAAPGLRGLHVSVRLILLLRLRISPLTPIFPFTLVEAVLRCWWRSLRPWL
jgi:hypothetical protein